MLKNRHNINEIAVIFAKLENRSVNKFLDIEFWLFIQKFKT